MAKTSSPRAEGKSPARERGAFLVFEGSDGGGKTTHARLLAAELEKEGRRVVQVHEPGSTPAGEQIRGILLGNRTQGLRPWTELLLFMAARAELAPFIRDRVAEKAVVISDRWLLSSVVYQGLAGRLDPREIERLGGLVAEGLAPDLTFVLDVPVEESLKRIGLAGKGRKKPPPSGQTSFLADAIEQRGREFLEKVRDGFLRAAKGRPDIVRIDARRPMQEVHAEILARARDVLG